MAPWLHRRPGFVLQPDQAALDARREIGPFVWPASALLDLDEQLACGQGAYGVSMVWRIRPRRAGFTGVQRRARGWRRAAGALSAEREPCRQPIRGPGAKVSSALLSGQWTYDFFRQRPAGSRVSRGRESVIQASAIPSKKSIICPTLTSRGNG